MKQYFNNEFLKRLISVIIYVPLVLLPLFYSNYVSIIFNLIFASIILEEIYQMKNNVEKKNLFNLYSILAIASFYFFFTFTYHRRNTKSLSGFNNIYYLDI